MKNGLVCVLPTLLPVTIEAFCGGKAHVGALTGQIACLKKMEGGKMAKPKRKEGKP